MCEHCQCSQHPQPQPGSWVIGQPIEHDHMHVHADGTVHSHRHTHAPGMPQHQHGHSALNPQSETEGSPPIPHNH